MTDITLQSIWEAIHQMKGQVSAEVNAHLDLKIGSVQAGLMDIQTTLNTVTAQVTELQQRVSTNEDDVAKLFGRMSALEKDNDYLKEKVEDLENRSRRSNLRFINVPEKSEKDDMLAFVSHHLLPAVLGKENFPCACGGEGAPNPDSEQSVQTWPSKTYPGEVCQLPG